MFRKLSPDPAYASKTAWRLIALVLALVLAVFVALVTADWWMPMSQSAPSVFVKAVSLIIPAAVCFALAAVVWAFVGLLGCAPSDRRGAWVAFSAATLTFLLLTGGLLLLAGVIRLPNI